MVPEFGGKVVKVLGQPLQLLKLEEGSKTRACMITTVCLYSKEA